MRNIDHISEPDADNDKCKLLNFQMPSIEFSGGGTHTASALLQAKVFHFSSLVFDDERIHNLHYVSEYFIEGTATQQENNMSHNRWFFKWTGSTANCK